MSPNTRFLLYAPNIHTGGGLVLLDELLKSWPNTFQLIAWLDARAKNSLYIPDGCSTTWVNPSVRSRLSAEVSLARQSRNEDIILCFHGLPPIFLTSRNVYVFLQNKLLLGRSSLQGFSTKTKIRIKFEQFVSYFFRHKIKTVVVQTRSMASSVRQWHGASNVSIEIWPFTPPISKFSRQDVAQWDFVYVADGSAHKNHRTLIYAWIHLAAQGIRPKLALTLSQRDHELWNWISVCAAQHGLDITNLGQMSHEAVLDLYSSASALVFPSKTESFGLPLIEASRLNLPIIAGELDFVRDVCIPVETFDPDSHISIARAILRFIGNPELPRPPMNGTDFLKVLLRNADHPAATLYERRISA